MLTTIADVMDALIGDVLTAIGPDAHEDFCIATTFPGAAVPLDYGAEATCKGTMWVRLIAANPSTTFPTPDTSVDTCYAPLAYPLELGILRKAPIATTPLGKLRLPSAEEHAVATRKQMDDLEAMHRGLKRLRKDVELMTIGTYQPIGPDGGLVGGIWTLSVGLE